MTAPTDAGALLFARYAFPPNALGYCGPGDPAELLERVHAGAAGPGLAALARQFDGAWPYLSLIAAASGRRDPLEVDVVRAYWIGNHLLERVPAQMLAAQLDERFARRIGKRWADLATLATVGGRAHHNFHVLAVYPWVGLLRGSRNEDPLRVLDGCRIAWGSVESVDGLSALVRSRPLHWTGSALRLGPPSLRRAALGTEGLALAAPVRPGDRVALHWDWVCDVLDVSQLRALQHYTRGQLRLVNEALGRPAADAVLR
jgi:hypothetical protein